MIRSAMMKPLTAGLLLLLSAAAHAEHAQTCAGTLSNSPDGNDVICSATWRFQGECTGDDMWNRWAVDGQSGYEGTFVHPWSTNRILVVGIDLLKLRNARWYEIPSRLWNRDREWFMVGSTIQPDAVIWLGPGESHSRLVWPKGLGQPWPKADEAKPIKPIRDESGKLAAAGGDLIDLHGQCYGGSATVFVTIYYTPESDASTTRSLR